MPAKKIVVVGGGSYTWTPVLVKDIILTRELTGSTIVLNDIDETALNDLYRYCKKLIREFKVDFKVVRTLDKRKAFSGADFVIVTISVGGFDTMQHDLDVPLKYGIHQPVGDTIGPGGLSRALRNIPVFIDMARLMERYCPDAWLLNYTNPMTAITRSVCRETSIKTIGLCHELFAVMQMIAGIFKVRKWKEIPVTLAGINHLAWILDFKIDGVDGISELMKMAKKGLVQGKGGRVKLANETHKLDNNLVKFELLKAFGALPAAGDRHLVEFFPYFLTDKSGAGKAYNVKLTSIEERRDQWLPRDKRNVHDFLNGKQKVKKQRSDETAARIIACLSGNQTMIDVINMPNKGQIPELPFDAVVETIAVIRKDSVDPVAVGRLPKPVLALLDRIVHINELTVEAAITGDRKKALEALLLDPLTRDFREAGKMLDKLLKANRDYLPQFFPRKKAARRTGKAV